MNGFEGELRERLLSLSGQARVTAAATAPANAPGVADWRNAARTVLGAAGVEGVAPYAELPALAVRRPEMLAVLLRGIDPRAAGSASELARAITQGHLADLTPGSGRIIVGELIAERLGLSRGDSLTVLVPTVDAGGAPTPKLREFTLAGTFEVGLPDHDATLVFAHLADVRALAPQGAASEGLRVRVHDVLAPAAPRWRRSEEHTSELQSLAYLVCRLLLEKKKKNLASVNYTTCAVDTHQQTNER